MDGDGCVLGRVLVHERQVRWVREGADFNRVGFGRAVCDCSSRLATLNVAMQDMSPNFGLAHAQRAALVAGVARYTCIKGTLLILVYHRQGP